KDLSFKKNSNSEDLKNAHFHFFDISKIPSLFFDFINQNFLNVYHYVLTPTLNYFEDIVSDFERVQLKKYWQKKSKDSSKAEELDGYLKERNRFLANFGKIKRNFQKVISSYDCFNEHENFQAYGENENFSLLNHFQNDLLFSENSKNVKPMALDDSIEIHVACSKFREVQILHMNILKLLNKDKSLKLSDIHVISADIESYAPFIHVVFNNLENFVEYKISNISLKNESSLADGFLKLLNLYGSRFEKNDLLDLFENPCFQRKLNFTKEEVDLIFFDWLENANIEFGIDEDHISEILENDSDHVSANTRSFKTFFSRILSSMTFFFNENHMSSSFTFDLPVEGVELSQSQTVEKLLTFFKNIIEDFELIKNEKNLSLCHIKDFLKKILNDYFQIDNSQIEKSCKTKILDFINHLGKTIYNFQNEIVSFEFVFKLLKSFLETSKTSFNQNEIEAICFSSFDISGISKKAIFAIGLDDSFPPLAIESSIKLVKAKEIPQSLDILKDGFLNLFLSARKHLFFSYTEKHDQKDSMSIFLHEFLSCLDDFYLVENNLPSQVLIKNHPVLAFDKSYFTKNNGSFSKSDYLAAKNYYIGKNSFSLSKPTDEITLPKVIDINQLTLLCKNPIKFYLTNVLDVFLEETKEDNDFVLSFLDTFLLKQASIKNDVDALISTYEKKGLLPHGIFNKIAKDKILLEIQNFLKSFQNVNIDRNEISSLEVNEKFTKFEKIDEKNYVAGPIEIEINNEKIKIVGKIENISKNSLMIFSDDTSFNRIKNFPIILIYTNYFSNNVTFLKNEKTVEFNIKSPKEALKKLVAYYLECFKKPSFLIKEWLVPIIKNDLPLLQKSMNNTYFEKDQFLDIYSKWYFKNFERPKAQNVLDDSRKNFEEIFKPILEEI
ncbi:MAG: exodeoxyribonuclease V subunit gamma, partial [Parachlamydiales bacterium]|nr:exodeoxyribonuclease V subunit gamma [Parachlamydiales bacterium]